MSNTHLENKTPLFLSLGRNHILVIVIFSLLYLSWTSLILGFRSDHLSFYLFILLMLSIHHSTRKFTYYFIFFIFFWIIYDAMRAFPNYLFNDVNIKQPYDIESYLFGILSNNISITPNEFFQQHDHEVLDLLSGLFYLTWVPVPLALAMYLFFKDKKLLLQFSAAYLFTNLIGFCIYYLYPAAPPWYFEEYGDIKSFDIPGSPALLVKFDALIGMPIFSNMYTKNSNVFAAIPSLHAAYPVVTWYYARKKKLYWASIFIFIDIIGIWFAAVYSYHHYFIDVIMGLLCAIVALIVFEYLIMKTRFSSYLDRYMLFAES